MCQVNPCKPARAPQFKFLLIHILPSDSFPWQSKCLFGGWFKKKDFLEACLYKKHLHSSVCIFHCNSLTVCGTNLNSVALSQSYASLFCTSLELTWLILLVHFLNTEHTSIVWCQKNLVISFSTLCFYWTLSPVPHVHNRFPRCVVTAHTLYYVAIIPQCLVQRNVNSVSHVNQMHVKVFVQICHCRGKDAN